MNDVTIVGRFKKGDGLGQHAIAFANCLYGHVKVNVHNTSPSIKLGLSKEALALFEKPYEPVGQVAILTDPVCYPDLRLPGYRAVPAEAFIKIAHSTYESDELPKEWVQIFNEKFDAVAVTDPWCKEIYLKNGVSVPIFVLPVCLELEELLEKPVHTAPRKPFVFLNSCSYTERKNQLLLIKAFHHTFGNSPDVKLKLHGRLKDGGYFNEIQELLCSLRALNIEMQFSALSPSDYITLMAEADCFVTFSKGEGFSVGPREALALGIPCILSNNSAHTTICDSGFVRPVPSHLSSGAYFECFMQFHGRWCDCRLEDASESLLDVYENYPLHLKKALEGREWVKRYLAPQLRPYYLNLVKPSKVELGDHDEITETALVTSSPGLYKKYLSLLETH